MNGFQKLHNQQDEFIKKTFQEDKIISQPIFDSIFKNLNETKVKVKKYSYKQQKIITILLLLLTLSICLNFYLAIVKATPITITNIFKSAKDYSVSKDKENSNNDNKSFEEDSKLSSSNEEFNFNKNIIEPDKNDSIVVENNNDNTNSIHTVEISSDTDEKEPINTTITPTLFTNINTNEVEEFVNQFAIGINKLSLNNTTNLESNTILLYIAQQYFSTKSNASTSLNIDTKYASSAENFHKFLSEFTINDYSTVNYLKSYNNYIGYASRSKSYIYGEDYSTIIKEKYNCQDVSITNEEDNIYTAKAKVTRNYEGEESTYEVTFTFKINNNYKYQKYKLLSLKAKLTSGSLDNTIHLVGN